MRLCDDKELFNNLLREISNKENILPEYIEKDYYAISIHILHYHCLKS